MQVTYLIKGWYPKYTKNLSNSTPQNTNNPIKNGQKTWIDIFPKKTPRWPTDTWKDAHHHWSSGRWKSKPQWDITSHLSEWLKSKAQETTSVGEDVENKEPSRTVGGNANWCSHFGKQYRSSSNKLKIELPYDPLITLLGIYHKDTDVEKRRGTCTPMFIAAMSTIVKLWRKPRCLSTDIWIKMWCIYSEILLSH